MWLYILKRAAQVRDAILASGNVFLQMLNRNLIDRGLHCLYTYVCIVHAYLQSKLTFHVLTTASKISFFQKFCHQIAASRPIAIHMGEFSSFAATKESIGTPVIFLIYFHPKKWAGFFQRFNRKYFVHTRSQKHTHNGFFTRRSCLGYKLKTSLYLFIIYHFLLSAASRS